MPGNAIRPSVHAHNARLETDCPREREVLAHGHHCDAGAPAGAGA
jgi:hypothetical protein